MALNILKDNHLNGPTGIETAATAIAGQITSNPSKTPGQTQHDKLWAVHWDIMHFCHAHPTSIDFAVHVLKRLQDLVPPEEKALAPRGDLFLFLRDMVRTVDGTGVSGPEDIGDEKDWDYDEGPEFANVIFTRTEVTEKLDLVLDKVIGLQKDRQHTIINWALEGRAHALDAAKIGTGYKTWVVMGFFSDLYPTGNRGMTPWNKADFIAGCVGFRATAKTAIDEIPDDEREGKVDEWTNRLKEFLLEGDEAEEKTRRFRDGDFAVKYHVALTLKNILNGPFDETSEELFNIEKWVY